MPPDGSLGRLGRRAFVGRSAAAFAAVGVAARIGVGAGEGADGNDADDGLYVETHGTSGPRIAFLPGLGGTTRYWIPPAGPLADRARLAFVDLLGFGRSPKPWTTYSVERHVAALHAALAGPDPVTLVGHSAGARLAVAYAARHPADVTRLVLVSLPYFGPAGEAQRYFRRRGAEGWAMTHIVPAALACLVSRRVFGWALPMAAGNMPREVAEDARRMTWRSSTSTLWEVVYGYDVAADLARVDATHPILCLHGDQDTTAPLGPMRELARTHRRCEVRVLPGGDHHLAIHHPEWVREQIADAMRSSVAAAPPAD